MPSASIYIKTLGGFCAYSHGRPVDVGRSKNKALLAFLAINKTRVFTRDYLADLLWCGSSLQNARHSLKQSIYELKRLLPCALDISTTSVSCEATNVETDISHIFQHLSNGAVQRAMPLLTGEFLQDVTSICGESFETWCSEFNRELFRQVDTKLEALLPSLSDDAISDLSSALLASVPLPKTATAIIPFIERAGKHKKQMGTRLGSRLSRLPLVGRQHQLNELLSAWKECENGKASFVAVVGKAGFGKTRLAEEFRERVAASVPIVLQAHCYRSERRIGFSAATDLIALALRNVNTSEIEPIWIDAINELLPSIGRSRELREPPPLSPAAAQVRLFESVRQVLQHLASHRTVLVHLEDGQWCDRSSQALLAHLSHRITNLPLFVLVTVRESGVADEKQPWFEWNQIHVKELSENDIQTAVDRLSTGGNLPTARELREASGGSPYFLTELIRFSGEGGSAIDGKTTLQIVRSSRSFTRTLIADLPRAARRCLESLAVIGRPIPSSVLKTVARVPDVETSLQRLLGAGFITVSQHKIALRHDLLREVVYRRTSPILRTELHQRTARILARYTDRAGETALHYSRAGRRSLAYKFARLGASQADSRYATEESISLLKLALKSAPSRANEVRPMLIERLHRAHHFAAAREEIRKYCSSAKSLTEDVVAFKLLDLDLAKELGLIDGPTLREKITELKQAADIQDKSVMLSALIAQGKSAFHDTNRAALIASINQLREYAGGLRTGMSCEALAMAARLHSTVHSVEEANQWLDEIEPHIRAINDNETRIRIMSIAAALKYQRGDLVSSEVMHRDMLMQIERIGAISLWPLAASHLHMVLIEMGKYDQAVSIAREITSRATELDAINTLIVLNANNASMLIEMGDLEGAESALHLAFKHTARSTSNWLKCGTIGAMGLCLLEQAKLGEAFRYADQGEAMLKDIGIRGCDLSHLEILISRARSLRGRRTDGINHLRTAMDEYAGREVVCHLKIKCELARALKSTDRTEARQHAKEVYEKASAIGARPLADRADALLHRL